MDITQKDTLEDIKQQLASVPAAHGVYLWKDTQGEVIYVGKAKQLRARMRQYVMGQDERTKIPLMLEQVASFDYIVTKNEHESLILEKNLIQQYAPFFNADFKDDKSYPFIAITKGDPFPAIKYTREKHKSETRYFGPYTNSHAAHEFIDIARRVVPICSSSCADWRKLNRILEGMKKEEIENYFETHLTRPCFNAHVGLGPGACCGAISAEEYAQNIKRVERFLSGSHREFLDELNQNMRAAADDLDFEKAARIKDRIVTINSLVDKQHAVSTQNLNADVVGIYREETVAGVHVFMIREGRIINSNEFTFNKGKDVPDEDLLRMFLLRYYDATTSIPNEIILKQLPEDKEVIEAWLTEKLNNPHGAKVRLVVPQRGEKAELLSMAKRNAQHTLMRFKVRTNYDDKRINTALLQLENALGLDEPPMRIECFDVSTIHGKHSVASMVVFTGGQPDKNQYRRFKIRMQTDEANDFAMMEEVLGRRYAPERMKDERFGTKPDLLIVDGGKPQLTAAMNQLQELGITDIAVAGLAKRDEELFVPWQKEGPIILPSGSASLYLVKQIRDEAHRFAITFHREVRGKAMTASILDEVVGLGPVRKKALIKAFKSFKNLKQATVEEIQAAKVIPDEVARELYSVLQQYNRTNNKDDKKIKDEADTRSTHE